MEIIKQFLFVALAFNCFLDSNAQRKESTLDNSKDVKLVIKARAKENEILLRWGSTDKNAWKLGNKYGYIIERATVSRNNIPLKESEVKILNDGPIKPRPISEWKTAIEENDMAAIAAQAIYGEEFVTSKENANAVIRIINQSSELQQRFGFTMYAIDQSFEASILAGLGYIDKKVNQNEEYLYNVKMAIPESSSQPQESGLIISPTSKLKLPQPYDFEGYYYNNAFVLIWEYDALQNFYNSYDLEKSEDGFNFKKINRVPITKLLNSEISGISFTDSIPKYEKKYWYRVRGKTIFGEMSPPSDTVAVIAHKNLLVAPKFVDNEIISDKEVVLKWSFAANEAWKVISFDILRSDSAPGPYEIIKKDIENKQNHYRYTNLGEINYFKVRANGIAGDFKDSSPNMIQPIDSIPPARPKGLSGIIDSLGVVSILWENNTELDLRGYNILKANTSNQEFTKLNRQEITKIRYNDTINLKSFNKKVYYKIVALDNRYNESKPSDILEIERPDLIPPSTALFVEYEITEKGILLSWQNSPSQDVTNHIIYRKHFAGSEVQADWQKIFETENQNLNQYIDKDAHSEGKYVYTIIAVDKNGLESKPSPILSVSSTPKLVKAKIKGFYAHTNREEGEIILSWRSNETDVQELQIFKKELNKPFSLLAILPSDYKKYVDRLLKINSIYNYGIKAIFKDGSVSEWNEIEVKY